MAQSYARLAAMKLYAYRAIDYVHTCSAADRRYLLFCAVQKARVSTEGVKVMALLSECIGAKGFESDTYFEMALRDAPLIPSLEGSTHINLKLTAQFIPRYFCKPDAGVADPPSLLAGEIPPAENPYLMAARTGVIDSVAFSHFLAAYESLLSIPNVRIFARQAKAFQLMVRRRWLECLPAAESPATQAMGHCLGVIAYAQLIAEHALRLHIPAPLIAVIFHTHVVDFSTAALALASCGEPCLGTPFQFRRMMSIPKTNQADWDFVAERMLGTHHVDSLRPTPGAGRRTG
jgi:acyl-CoA dehydrogenase